jgi:hypothetical protein
VPNLPTIAVDSTLSRVLGGGLDSLDNKILTEGGRHGWVVCGGHAEMSRVVRLKAFKKTMAYALVSTQ